MGNLLGLNPNFGAKAAAMVSTEYRWSVFESDEASRQGRSQTLLFPIDTLIREDP